MSDFYRYGDQARAILRFAHIAAVEAKAKVITVEHILLSLAWTAPELLGRFIREPGSAESLIRQLCHEVPRLTAPGTGAQEIAFSAEVALLLLRVAEEADESEIGPAHIMLAIMRDKKSRAADLLRSQGVDVAEVELFVRSLGQSRVDNGPAEPEA
jgi:ATP-dependent Clp protease ATP-binding subunit ClpA